MKKFTFNIETLGCKVNQYESEAILEILQKAGGIFCKKEPDIFIINTCSITAKAEKKSILKVKQALKKKKKVYVTGCSCHTFDFKRLKGNLEIVFNEEKENFFCKKFLNKDCFFQISNFFFHTRAFIKIQDGCDNFCSYCIVPYTRKRARSRKMQDILQEIKRVEKNGFKEIVLTAIDIGQYKRDEKNLCDLLQEVEKIDGIKRIRISSISPNSVTKDFINIISNSKKICPHLHISLQSGSNKVLKLMNRKYLKEDFLEKVYMLLSKNKNFLFTTDVIVGFFSEEEKDFQDTLDILQKVKFLKVHIFPYSAREKTKAFYFKNKVPLEIIYERKKYLQKVADNIAFNVRERFLNKKLEILIEKRKNFGYTKNFIPVKIFEKGILKANEFADIKIIENKKDFLIGKICK